MTTISYLNLKPIGLIWGMSFQCDVGKVKSERCDIYQIMINEDNLNVAHNKTVKIKLIVNTKSKEKYNKETSSSCQRGSILRSGVHFHY